jgi:fatty acid desaturase
MAKKPNELRQARGERAKEAKQAKRDAEASAQRRRQLQIRASAAVAVLTLVVAGLCYWVFDNRQLLGITLLIGGVLFLLLALGALASGVQPRDRTRAGSIDYGKRD